MVLFRCAKRHTAGSGPRNPPLLFIAAFLVVTAMLLASPLTVLAQDAGTFTDTRDGQSYRWVRIGSQVWMAEEARGLGLFVRSLVGMDRSAAKDALAVFITGKTLTANQLEFINLIVDHLTEHGVIEPARLYESPFTDLTPRGPDGLFAPAELEALIRALDAVRATAVAA